MPNQGDTLTVSIVRTVKPGHEADFEKALHEFAQRTLVLPGQLGVHVMRPAPGSSSREYGIVRKFSSREALAQFRSSDAYLEWSRNVRSWTEGEARTEELSGLESWFTVPGAPLKALPRWKMALATYMGVLPLSTVLNLAMGPTLKTWNIVASNALFDVCIVAGLTWVLMPVITRLLHRWLYRDVRSTTS